MRSWILGAVLAALPQAALWAAPLAGEQAAIHVLNRLAYGPRPGDIERVRQSGIQAILMSNSTRRPCRWR